MSLSDIDSIVINVSGMCQDSHLRSLGWFRRKTCYDLLDIVAFLQDQMNLYGSQL